MQNFFRPGIAAPYGKTIFGPTVFTKVPTSDIGGESYEATQSVQQFIPDKVAKILTGPKNTGKTFLNNQVLKGVPALSVDFRGRVMNTQDIVDALDEAMETVPRFHERYKDDLESGAYFVRSGSGWGLSAIHTANLAGAEVPYLKDLARVLGQSWGMAAGAISALNDKTITREKDPILRWERAIQGQAEKCKSQNYTIPPLYIHLEELNAALPDPEKESTNPEEWQDQMDFFNRLMAMLVRVTKEEGHTQVIMTTSDHVFQQVVKTHWGDGHSQVYCLGHMDEEATRAYMKHKGLAHPDVCDYIWKTCGGNFPQLDSAINFTQYDGVSFKDVKKSFEGEMNQATGFQAEN